MALRAVYPSTPLGADGALGRRALPTTGRRTTIALAALLLAGHAAGGDFAFTPSGRQFRFDTGALRGTLRSEGRSIGLIPLTDTATGAAVARSQGLLSPYRMLTAERRFGEAAWDWASTASLQADGSVLVTWSADAAHPYGMTGAYRWASSNALDLAITVAPTQDLKGFEVFLASYFEGFESSFGYAEGNPAGFREAKQSDAFWHMFPRDEAGAALIRDGRWRLPPHPVEWTLRPAYAGALAMRRDAKTGLVALVMAPTEDCFAVAMPYGEESHRSLYLCLFGRDLEAGEAATARVRLVIARGLTDQEAVGLYKAYQKNGST
jgi:hypothetical protein